MMLVASFAYLDEHPMDTLYFRSTQLIEQAEMVQRMQKHTSYNHRVRPLLNLHST